MADKKMLRAHVIPFGVRGQNVIVFKYVKCTWVIKLFTQMFILFSRHLLDNKAAKARFY